ncbi:MAG: tyrosine-type recombinase/integrase [Akkermansia sp.]|nr:tyrosine-type recombinase/integrase [Akkermansia sp.]
MKAKNQHPDHGLHAPQEVDTKQLLISVVKNSTGKSPAAVDDFLDQLKVVIKAFAQMLETTEPSVSFRRAAEFSLIARDHRRPSTKADLRSYITRMCNYKELASTNIRDITIPDCHEMMQACFGHSKHSFRKAQSVLHSIFNYAERQGWCSTNPARAILRPPVVETKVEILTLQEISTLLKTCHLRARLRCMEPALRLMLWCGIRPTEVRRLQWSDIDPDEMLVYVEGQHSKTGGARAVPLRGGAAALAQAASTSTGRIAPANWEHLWRNLRQEAGFRHWQNDALRHTFASMHLKRYHNLPLLQEEMGHRNAALLQTRYLNLRNLKKNTATLFFQEKRWP